MKTVGLFFGGMSNEHDVSLASAKNIIQQIDTKKYELLLFYISSKGDLYQLSTLMQVDNIQELPTISFKEIQQRIDIAFPITHGKYGEDGNLQGFFEWYHIPYCGCRILSSALCMDKGMFKQMMQSANIPQVPFSTLDFSLISNSELSKSNLIALSDFSLPLYVKPANSGSSIGITKVEDFKHLSQAIEKARTYDTKIIVEQGLIALKEIEVAVIGNEHLTISEPGELVLVKDFYAYEDKYINNEATVKIPADITLSQHQQIKKLAETVYRKCECRGFARIDFFIANGEVYINEVNTLPGFTDISMFPMLIKHSGISYTQLIDIIISLAY